MTKRIHFSLLIGIILSSGFVYLAGNNRVALWDRDEPRYAQTSRQMLQSGDWVVPHYLDKPRTAKPALIYWCQASAMMLFGDNEFAARFPSAVATVVLLIVLAVVLWQYCGSQLAVWTVFIFATSGLTIAAAKMCITDAVLLLWVTIGQICVYAIYRGRATWAVVLTLAMMIGLGALTKGPVILGFYATTLFALIFLRFVDSHWPAPTLPDVIPLGLMPNRPQHLWKKVGVGLLIILAIVLPWILMVNYRASGFILLSLKLNVWGSDDDSVGATRGSAGVLFSNYLAHVFPLELTTALTIGLAIRRRNDPETRFALAAIMGPWIMLECVRTKLPHYFLPVFPPLAFLTAEALLRCIRGELNDLKSKGFMIAVGIWALLVTAAASAPWIVEYDPLPKTAMLAITTFEAVFGMSVFAAFAMRRVAIGAAVMGCGTSIFVAILYTFYLPNAEFLRLSPRVAKILIDHHVTQPDQVIMLDYMEPSLAFAQGGTIREAGPIGFSKKFEPLMPPWLVVSETIWNKAPDILRNDFDIVASESGLAYADHGKWITVMVIHRK